MESAHGSSTASHRIFRLLDRVKGAQIVRVGVLMCGMILLAHWLACIWCVTTPVPFFSCAVLLLHRCMCQAPPPLCREAFSLYYRSTMTQELLITDDVVKRRGIAQRQASALTPQVHFVQVHLLPFGV